MVEQLLQWYTKSNLIPIRKRVQQSDTISSYSQQEDIFGNLDLDDCYLSINQRKLSNLRFANDINMISENLQELELGLNSAAIKQKDLIFTMTKTKVLCNKHVYQRQAIVEGSVIEQVQS